MKKSLLSLLLVISSITILTAQKNSDISGYLKNNADEELISATAILYFEKDSVLTGYAITDESGYFQISNVAPGNYYLQFSYLGYKGKEQTLSKDEFNGQVDLGTIVLQENNELDAVVITNAPLEVRKDTIIYDASAFSTKQNATVEDLLKELPGIEVDDDGSITAQGEEVQKVLVDGKKFFGDDPKIATKNLPADAVDKIEVYDKKSEKAEFTGIEDGEEEKTIDIQLKEDRKNGYFGNVNAGGGTEETYNAKAMVSRFSPTVQLSAIASRNNINDLAFSPRDYFSMNSSQFSQGGSIRMSGGGVPGWNQDAGINTATTGGFNLNTALSDKLDLYANYFFNQTKTNYDLFTNREYFNNTGNLYFDENSFGDNLVNNHRAAVDFTYRPSKKDEIKLESAFTFANGDRTQSLNSETVNANNSLVNDNTTDQSAENENIGIQSTLFYKHRFAKQGRALFTEFSMNLNEVDNQTNTNSVSNFYLQNNTESFNQLLDAQQDNTTYRGEISYSEPLGKDQYLEANYRFNQGDEVNDQNFFNLNDNSFIEDLSNEFNRDLFTQNAGINYKLIKGKHNIDIGATYQASQLNGTTSFSDSKIEKDFNQLLPSLNWRYDINDGSNFNIGAGSSMQIPSVRQLQPAIDNTNPLNIYQGNENLDASTQYYLNGRYHLFNRFSFTNVFAYVNFGYTNDPITTAQTFNANGVQRSQPVNTDNSFSTNASVSFSKPIRSIRSRLRISPRFSAENGQIFINGNENDYNRLSHSYRIRIDNTNNDIIDVGVNTNLSFNSTAYSEDSDRDQSFSNQTFGLDANYKGITNWEIYSEFDYRVYSQEEFAEDNTIPFWTAGISRSFAQNLGEVRLELNDLLNQNTGISRSQNLNYSQEEVSNVLGRYGMLSLRWQIKSGGTRGSDKPGAPPPPPH